MNKLLSIGIVLLMINCTNRKDDQEKIDSTAIIEENPARSPKSMDTIRVNEIEITQSNLQILEMDKTPTLRDSTSEYKSACLKWRLSDDQVIKIFRLSKVISGSEVHDLYYDLPCRINGQVRIQQVLFNFIINGGSFTYVYNSNQRFYLGCAQEKCKEFFIEQGGNIERDVPDL